MTNVTKLDQLNALDESIKKWEGYLEQTDPTQIELNDENCPCCKLTGSCCDCLIAKFTFRHQCHATPFYKVRVVLSNWLGFRSKNSRQQFLTEAQNMINLMKDIHTIAKAQIK